MALLCAVRLLPSCGSQGGPEPLLPPAGRGGGRKKGVGLHGEGLTGRGHVCSAPLARAQSCGPCTCAMKEAWVPVEDESQSPSLSKVWAPGPCQPLCLLPWSSHSRQTGPTETEGGSEGCALFLFFSPQISQTAPVQGGTARLPEPKKSSSMARP